MRMCSQQKQLRWKSISNRYFIVMKLLLEVWLLLYLWILEKSFSLWVKANFPSKTTGIGFYVPFCSSSAVIFYEGGSCIKNGFLSTAHLVERSMLLIVSMSFVSFYLLSCVYRCLYCCTILIFYFLVGTWDGNALSYSGISER